MINNKTGNKGKLNPSYCLTKLNKQKQKNKMAKQKIITLEYNYEKANSSYKIVLNKKYPCLLEIIKTDRYGETDIQLTSFSDVFALVKKDMDDFKKSQEGAKSPSIPSRPFYNGLSIKHKQEGLK